MQSSWRATTGAETEARDAFEDKPFGALAPNLAQHALIALGQRTVLRRGVFRGSWTRLILALSGTPLDIRFRGAAFRIRGERNLIEYGLLLNPAYNGADIDFLLGPAPEGAVFLDLGSNIGLYSLPLAVAAGPKGRVISIDANPMMAKRLIWNAAASGIDSLAMHCCAVSNRETRGDLLIRKDDVAIVAVEEKPDGAVPVHTLAAIVEEERLTRIDGLKIDIEGHEDKALVPFLDSAPAALLPRRVVIEHPLPDADYPGCAAAFARYGYRLVGRSRNNSFYERAG